jgi:nitroreductase
VVSSWKTQGRDVILRGAPHLLVTSAPKDAPCPVQDTHIALATFELLASSHGLGTLWDGLFMMALSVCPELVGRLGIPADHILGYAMLFGKPAVEYHRPARRGPAKVNMLG